MRRGDRPVAWKSREAGRVLSDARLLRRGDDFLSMHEARNAPPPAGSGSRRADPAPDVLARTSARSHPASSDHRHEDRGRTEPALTTHNVQRTTRNFGGPGVASCRL